MARADRDERSEQDHPQVGLPRFPDSDVMMLVTVTSELTGDSVQRIVSPEELATLSGVQLAALLFPNPTEGDIATVNEFLGRYRDDATVGAR